MRVLFLTDSLSDLDGVGRYTVRLIQALQRARPDFEPRVLLARKHRPTSREVPAGWEVEVGLPPDYFFHMSPARFWVNAALAVPRVRARAKDVDLVHAIKDYPHSWVGLRGARSAGKPTVGTAHGTYSVQPLLVPRHEARARWTYRNLDALIAVSGHTRDRLFKLLPPEDLPRDRVQVIPNAVSAAHYAARRDVGQKAWHRWPFTLAIGEIKERKGHHVSLEAFQRVAARFPDLHHIVVGHGTGDEYEQSLRERVRANGLEARVHFLGNVSEDEKVDLLQTAQIFVHTPVDSPGGGFEGFGIVYLEAAACGTPSVGTLGSGAEDAIVHGASGLLVAPDAEATARALEQLLTDQPLHARLRAGAQEHAARSSWDDNARAVLGVYETVLAPEARVKHRLAELVRSRFFRDTATLQVAGMLNQVSQFASTVVLAFLLGARGQGLFVTAITLQGLLHFLINTGVVPATVSQIAAAHVRGNHDKTAGWIAFLAKAALVFGLAVLVIGWFVLPWFGERFYDSRDVGTWALWLCLEPIFDLPRTVAAAAFQGTRRMRALAQVESADEVVRFFLVVVGATITGSPAGAVLGMLAAAVFGSILAIELYASARHDGGPSLPGPKEILARMKEVPLWRGMRLGIRVGLLKNGTALFLTIFPRLIIGKVVGLEWVSYFHIAQRIMTIPTMPMLSVSRTSLPALAELAGKKDWVGFRRLFTRITLITGTLITVAMLTVILLIPAVVGAVFPSDYVVPVFTYAWILAIGYVPYAFAAAIDSVYIAANQVKAWLWLTVIGAAITIPTNVWLIVHIKYTGVAWGLALYQSWVLVHLGYIYWLMVHSGRGGFGPPSARDVEDARVLEAASIDLSGRSGGPRE